MNGPRLLALLLLPLLLTSLPLSAAGAQRKGLSLFAEPSEEGTLPASDAPYYVGAAAATVFTEATCIAGDVLGFSVGVVFRWPVWVLTLGDTFGSSEGFDRAANAILEAACDAPWVFNPAYLKSIDPKQQATRPPTVIPESR